MIKENDFVEIEYTGYIKGSNEVFDTTDEKIAKENGIYNENSKYGPIKIVVGRNYIIPGLDKALIGKEEGKEFEVDVNHKEAFGERKDDLVMLIPEREFLRNNIKVKPGMNVIIDGKMGKVISKSSGRVIVDFNHPLAGKDLHYKVKITRKIENLDEKVKTIFDFFNGESEVKIEGEKAIVKLKEMPKEREYNIIKKEIAALLPIKELELVINEKLNI